jgi:hypothetical protein
MLRDKSLHHRSTGAAVRLVARSHGKHRSRVRLLAAKRGREFLPPRYPSTICPPWETAGRPSTRCALDKIQSGPQGPHQCLLFYVRSSNIGLGGKLQISHPLPAFSWPMGCADGYSFVLEHLEQILFLPMRQWTPKFSKHPERSPTPLVELRSRLQFLDQHCRVRSVFGLLPSFVSRPGSWSDISHYDISPPTLRSESLSATS